MTRPGDCFTEVVDGDGDVTIPYEGDTADACGLTAVDAAGHTPCDCDPADVFDLKQFVERALWRHANKPEHFTDKNYIEECQEAHRGLRACINCIDATYLHEFELVLDEHHIKYG